MRALILDFFGVIYRGERSEPIDHELLAWLSELRPHYKMAVLSNVQGLYRYVDRPFLEQFFDVLAPSDELGHAKPQPAAYLKVAELLGCQPAEAVFIDDIADFVTAAQSVGMTGIVYTDLQKLQNDLAQQLSA